MQSSEYQDFQKALQKVFALYEKQLSNVVLDVWWEALRPHALSDVTRALTAHIRNPDSGSYLPKPADVIKGLAGNTANTAQSAWTKVDSAARRKGPYVSVAFDDPIIHRVLADMGGWIRMCGHTNDEWPFIQKEFESRYRGFAMQGGVTEYPAKLIGIAEDENIRSGVRISAELQHKTNPIALIGDASKAEKVITGGTVGPLVPITARLAHENGSEQTRGPRSVGQSAEIVRLPNKAQGS